VKATTFYDDPDVLAKVVAWAGRSQVGINVEDIAQPHGSPNAAGRGAPLARCADGNK